MGYKFLILIVLLSFVLILPRLVLADGGIFIPDYDQYVYLPSQKAAIFWDGIKETMILSTRIRTDEITDMAWVTPIPSSVKPEVEKGNIEVFYDLASLFTPPRGKGIGFPFMAGTLEGGVDVVELKEVDIYDIAILRATSASVLVRWLNDNGYVVPENTIPILQDYCNLGNYYFIADRIDLENLENLDVYKEIMEKVSKLKNIKQNIPEDTDLFSSYELTENLKSLTWQILKNKPYYYEESTVDLLILIDESEEEYNSFLQTYAIDTKEHPLAYDLIYHYNHYLEDCIDSKVVATLTDEGDILEEIVVCNEDLLYTRRWYNDKKYHEDRFNYIKENIETLRVVGENFHDLYPILERKSDESEAMSYVLQGYQVNSDLENEIRDFCMPRDYYGYRYVDYSTIEEKMEECDVDEDCFEELLRLCVGLNLKNGIATPLKITFQPDIPFYPLKISSINEGETEISVYVFSEHPTEDQSTVLSVSKMAKLTTWLKEKYNLTNENYVTLLTYNGSLKNLHEDSFLELTSYNPSLDPNYVSPGEKIIEVFLAILLVLFIFGIGIIAISVIFLILCGIGYVIEKVSERIKNKSFYYFPIILTLIIFSLVGYSFNLPIMVYPLLYVSILNGFYAGRKKSKKKIWIAVLILLFIYTVFLIFGGYRL